MAKKYVVELTEEERKQLLRLLKKGKVAARKLCRARILLQADDGADDVLIATTLHTGVATVERTRKRFIEEGLDAALTERRRPGGQPKLRGKDEALLIATACSVPPSGRTRWTLQLLADRLMEMGVIDSISDDTVGRMLKKTPSNRG
jgi:putative transposase